MGQHQGKGPLAQGRRNLALPPTAPQRVHSTENTSSPTTPCGGSGRRVRWAGVVKTTAGSGGEAAETSSYPWEETMGRLILLLVVMAFSSHLEGQQ